MNMIDAIFQNSEDFLNIALGCSAILLTLFTILVLVRLFRVLGTLDIVLQDIQDTLDILQNYLWQPARIFLAVKEKLIQIFSFWKK